MAGGVSVDDLKKVITAMPAEQVYLWDESDGCGSKFGCVVVATKFEGMKLLDRQRAVNDAIKEHMPKIHAFSMKTWTPAQFEQKKQTGEVPAQAL